MGAGKAEWVNRGGGRGAARVGGLETYPRHCDSVISPIHEY